MKFKFGDIVYYIPFKEADGSGNCMQVIRYDEVRKKYLCMEFDSYAPTSFMYLCYAREEDLDYLRNIDPEAEHCYICDDGTPLIPEDFDEYYYDVQDYEGLEQQPIRNAVRHYDFEGDIPRIKDRYKRSTIRRPI